MTISTKCYQHTDIFLSDSTNVFHSYKVKVGLVSRFRQRINYYETKQNLPT